MAKQDQLKVTKQMKEYLGLSQPPPIIQEPSFRAMAKQDQLKVTKQMKEYLGLSQPPPIIQEPSMEAIGYRVAQRSPLRTRAHGEADRLVLPYLVGKKL
jgi:hypothetical protein